MAKYMVEDILTHSMEIEEAGQKFYALLADRLNDAKLKNIFTAMARQETGHYEFYKTLHEQLLETQKMQAAPVPPAPTEKPAETGTGTPPPAPETQATPETPVAPEASETPVTSAPETPVTPESPATLETLETLETPGTPDIQSSDTEPFDYKKQRLLEDRIFNRLTVVQKTPKIKTLGDALAFMIDTEIDVVDYFENARKLINPQGQVMMQKIINEEKSHVRQLLDLRSHYQSVMLK